MFKPTKILSLPDRSPNDIVTGTGILYIKVGTAMICSAAINSGFRLLPNRIVYDTHRIELKGESMRRKLNDELQTSY